MPLTLIITDAGRAALVNAAATGTAPVTISQIGLSATAHVPDPDDTALPGEFKRLGGVGGLAVPPATIHVSATDASADAYTVRSFALYLSTGTLFAIYGQADPIVEKTAASMAALALDVVLVDVDITALDFGDAFFSNPQATTEQMGIAELATLAEARAGEDNQRIVTPSTAKNSLLQWLGYTPLNRAQLLTELLLVDGPGSGIDADLLDGLHGSDYALAGAALGQGQTWQNVAAARGRNTVYRNTTLRPIQVSMRFVMTGGTGSPSFDVSADNATWAAVATAVDYPVSVIVPPGHYYRLNAPSATGNIMVWAELR
jgi:hypothetical protein